MGITRLLAITALVCAVDLGAAQAQQAGPPPAVLVQAAELKPLAARSEFIGRAAAVDKVDLRARVKGFLGPRKFNDGDQVKEGQVLFTIEPEHLPGDGRPEDGGARCRQGRARPTPKSSSSAPPSCCAPTPARRRPTTSA